MLPFDPYRSASALLSKIGKPEPASVVPLLGGRNNLVWAVTSAQRCFLLKRYFWSPDDPRDRMGHEWKFLHYLEAIGCRRAPEPLACDPDTRCALMEFIEGHPLEIHELTREDVETAVGFFEEMNCGTSRASTLPPVSEACFSLEAHLSTVASRMARARGIESLDEFRAAARQLVSNTLEPLWATIEERIRTHAHSSLSDVLPPEQRCLSPSDFGFHNALRQPDGSLRFLDFEYAGWDDPAKTIIDFCNQPDRLLPEDLAAIFRQRAILTNLDPDLLAARISLLEPLYQLKWACICLTGFLPGRVFSDPRPERSPEIQLARAKCMAERAETTLSSISGKLSNTFRLSVFPSGDKASINRKESDLPTPVSLYRSMLRIRMIEEKIADLYPEQEMRCPVHLSIGQEAVAAGAGAAVSLRDYAMSGHRSHAHYLAKGGSLVAMLAEIYGRSNGCCSGKGGSMHLIDRSVGFLGAVPIVGSTIPIAVGTALSSKMEGVGRVTLAFFGEGATEEGVFHESINFASLKNLPVIFVCENNLYSVYTPMNARQPAHREVFEQARAHGVEAFQADGNNVESVLAHVTMAVEKARRGDGPTFLEFLTYRWREHCGPDYDNDIGYRSPEEFEKWKIKCPIESYRAGLEKKGLINESVIEKMKSEIRDEIEDAVSQAKSSPFPLPEVAASHLFSA